MPQYQRLGQIPRKHHIWFHRNGAAPTYKNEGIAYEHVITTEGFNEAYSIMYHLRPPTRVRNVELIKHEELKKVSGQSAASSSSEDGGHSASRRSLHRPHPDAVQSGHDRVSRAAGEDVRTNSSITRTAARTKSFLSSKAAGRLRRFSANCVIARRITSSFRVASHTGSCPIKLKRKIILFSNRSGPVRIPQRYLNHEGQIKMGSPYSERDFHGADRAAHHRQGRRCRGSGERWPALDLRDAWRIIRSMWLVGMATSIPSPSTRRISSRLPARCINRRRFIKLLRFAVTSSAPLRRACSIRIRRPSRSRGCTTTSKRTKSCFTSAEISDRGAESRAARSRCIRAAFRTGRIRARSWRARMRSRTEELAVMFDTAAYPRADGRGPRAR